MSETDDRIRALAREILSLSKARLLVRYRFLDRALYALKPCETELTDIATDGEHLYYRPMPLIRAYQSETGSIVRIWGHMLMHCIFRHMFTGAVADQELWDLACDIAAEAVLSDLHMRELEQLSNQAEREEILEELSEDVKMLTAEKIYRYLLDHSPSDDRLSQWMRLFSADDHTLWHDRVLLEQLKAITGGTLEAESERDGTEVAGAVTPEAMWQELAEQIQVALETFGKEQGDTSGRMEQALRAVNREKCDYRVFLRKFAARTEVMKLSPDEFDYVLYTYGIKLYKDMPLIEPLEYRDEKRIREIVIAIDTSGSVAGELVQAFLQKTFTVLKQEETFDRHFILHIIQCDAEIREDAVITCQEDFDSYIRSMTIKGLGGTDFRPVFTYVAQLQKEKKLRHLGGLLYFTDGYGTFPSAPTDYPTAFIFLEKDEYILPQVPAWAIRIVLEEDNVTVFDSVKSIKHKGRS